jgi:hypothetical protein
MRALKALAASVAVAAALGLAACGGDDDDGDASATNGRGESGAAATGSADACSLLTEREVTAAMGEPTATSKGGTAPAGPDTEASQCTWTGPEPPASELAVAKTVTITTFPGEQYYAPDQYGAGLETRSGVCEEAAIGEAGGTAICLQDGVTILIQFLGSTAEPKGSALEDLARAAAGRV